MTGGRRELLKAAYVRSAKTPFEVHPLMEDADNDDAGCRRPEVTRHAIR